MIKWKTEGGNSITVLTVLNSINKLYLQEFFENININSNIISFLIAISGLKDIFMCSKKELERETV